MNDLIKLCGLWRRTSKSGREYLAGRLGNTRILIWENPDKAGADDPTHVVMLGEPVNNPANTGAARSARAAGTAPIGGNQFKGGRNG